MDGMDDFWEFLLEEGFFTFLKISVEPKNHPIEKEHHLPSTSTLVFHVNFRHVFFIHR